MASVHIVIAHRGQHSDYENWNVLAYTSAEAAQAHVERIEQMLESANETQAPELCELCGLEWNEERLWTTFVNKLYAICEGAFVVEVPMAIEANR